MVKQRISKTLCSLVLSIFLLNISAFKPAHAVYNPNIIGPLYSLEFDPMTPIHRFDYNISYGIESYLSPKLLEFFHHNIDTIFEKNGFSPSSYYLHEYTNRTGETLLDDMIDNPTSLRSLKNIRYYFRKFFRGIRIRDTHDFEFKLNGIDLSANWTNFGAQVAPYAENSEKIIVLFTVEADRLAVNLTSLRFQDHKHNFIGEIGGDKLFIQLDQANSPKLKLIIPIEIDSSGEFLDFKVKEIESNVQQIQLQAGWNAPLTLPKVKVSINGQTAYLRADKVERALKDEIPNLLEGLREKISDYVSDNASNALEGFLNESFGDSNKDIYKLDPFWAPDEELARIIENNEQEDIYFPNAYILGLGLHKLNMRKGHLRVSLETFLEDGLHRNNNPMFRGSHMPVSAEFLDNSGYDIATSVNSGIINKYIQLSCSRGYFNDVELGENKFSVIGCPYVYFKENQEIRLVVKIRMPVTGMFNQAVIHNPLELQFEMGLKLQLEENATYSLILTRIYENTVKIEDRFIKIKFLKKQVFNSAKKQLQELNKEYRDYELYEGIPIPNIVFGIPLKNLGYKLDPNGHLIFYHKTVL